jgi:hypothetical protein
LIDEGRLCEGLKRLLTQTELDIRERLAEEPPLDEALKSRHTAAVEAGRADAGAWHAFCDDAITQAAVHWLLAAVFCRFLEDNRLIAEAWIAGPGDRLTEAHERQSLFYRENRHANDADYLTAIFARTAALPGMAELFSREHNPLWSLGPSGPQAMQILRFFRQREEETGGLAHDFTDPQLGTRFLGDLYQNLSKAARERYALCQTPGFVVDFILDRTLTPALDVFGLEATRMIDPTCGSGHFLLAAFDRLYRKWQDREPVGNPRVLAQRALDAVCGVDLNPFAVAIARFRLLVAALATCGINRLKDAPDFHFELAVGDSLLHGRLLGRERAIQYPMGHDPASHFFVAEDGEALERILGRQYQAVVGNPPYINVDDPKLRKTYRNRYGSCHGKYQLSVPFVERFFDLGTTEPAGFVGLIVANGFTKREFGKTLVEDYLPKLDLTHVVDTSGAFIPGHATATAILFGRNKPPVAETVRAVRSIRAESREPRDPSTASVWSAISGQVDLPGSESKWVSVSDVPRSQFGSHPWAMGGGGAAELKQQLSDQFPVMLRSESTSVGITSFTLEDDVYTLDGASANRMAILSAQLRPLIEGDNLRDWCLTVQQFVVFPYDSEYRPLAEESCLTYFWPFRTNLANSKMFGNETKVQAGLKWFEFGRLTASKLRVPLSIAFAEITTHNSFVLDRGGKVFKNSAPVIKLPDGTAEELHIGLLGLLNSSTGCFWLKQVCYSKGTGGNGRGIATESWEQGYCFNGTNVEEFPLPNDRPLALAAAIQAEADARAALMPDHLRSRQTPTAPLLSDARNRATEHLARMIALQEELDWQVYHLYGLLEEDLSLPPDQVPPIQLGERPFEILMARQVAAGEIETAWFARHRATPITGLPAHWPEHYRHAVERRIEIIQSNRDIALIEAPEYKRRWNLPTWEELQQRALENWLLDRMEACALWQEPELKTCARLADVQRRDADFVSVGALYRGKADFDIAALVTELALKQSVPFLPVLRYSESGMRKRAVWEEVWNLQRCEDAGEKVEIPVPPKYTKADFLNGPAWSLRGSLDVPKERFILYPHLQREADSTPVLGWAGWDHLMQAKALAAYYAHVKEEDAWPVERLKPVLAGIAELVPWLKQWHNEPDPTTGSPMGDAFETYLETECQALGFPVSELKNWRPPQAAPGRARRTKR